MLEKITFEIKEQNIGIYSLNKIYGGIHWSTRAQHAQYWHLLVRSAINRDGIKPKLFEEPVRITILFNDRLDIDNHGYVSKMIVDSLKGVFIKDDSRKYVVSLLQEFYEGKGIKVCVEKA